MSSPSTVSDPGVRWVARYKLVRAAGALSASIALAMVVLTGDARALSDWIEGLSAHWASGVSSRVAAVVVHALDAHHVWIVTGALALDGALTSLEAFALYRGYVWGPWLVVAATSLLIPFELHALLQKPTLGRALLLAANLFVAVYLARRALREHRHTPSAVSE